MIIDNNPVMMGQDEIIRLATELAEAVDNNWLVDGEKAAGYTYAHLVAMFFATGSMEDGNKLYNYCYDAAIRCGKSNIDKRLRDGQKIKVAFLPISAAEWPAERIYKMLRDDDRFLPVVVPVPIIGRTKEERGKTYSQTYKYFEENGYNVEHVYDPDTEEITGWEDIGGVPDVVIHVTPWYLDMVKNYQIINLPFSVLNVYISYGLTVGNSQTGRFDELCMYNKEFMNLCWRVYTETKTDYEEFIRYEALGGKNVRNSGYIKMDYFYDEHSYTEKDIRNMWGIPENRDANGYKKVIIAPHFSVGDTNVLSFSTFDKNMYFYIYLAKKYKDSISFVFKPHPNLRNGLVKHGYMKSIDEYEAYLDEFRRLPNARVQEEGSYLELFDTSDAMIDDSISFVGEYLYTGKPMLFLERPEQRFNELGKKIIDAPYKVKGTDYYGIDTFLEDVVLAGNDTRKAIRQRVYEEELDYAGINGIKASDYIYNDIANALLG